MKSFMSPSIKSFGKAPFIGETDGRKSQKMAYSKWAIFFGHENSKPTY
jgi:hypothetical protein